MTTVLPARPATSHRRPAFAKLAAAGVTTFFAASVVTAALTPGYRTTRDSISSLAATDSPYAGLMIAGFLAGALGLAATGVALWQRLQGRAAPIMLFVCSVLMAAAGLFRQDCSDAVPTCVDYDKAELASWHYWTHQYVSLALFLTMVAVAFVLARAVRRTAGLRYLTGPARIVAWSLLVLTAAAMTAGFGAYNGLVQRPFLALMFGWPILVAGLAPRD